MLLSLEGQRVRARLDLVFAIEGYARALVDAKRGGDEAGQRAAAEAIQDAIEARLQGLKREEESS